MNKLIILSLLFISVSSAQINPHLQPNSSEQFHLVVSKPKTNLNLRKIVINPVTGYIQINPHYKYKSNNVTARVYGDGTLFESVHGGFLVLDNHNQLKISPKNTTTGFTVFRSRLLNHEKREWCLCPESLQQGIYDIYFGQNANCTSISLRCIGTSYYGNSNIPNYPYTGVMAEQ